MGKIFAYDSPLIQSINKIVDCVFVSILWLIFSLPIITFGASTSALYYTVNKVIHHNRSHIFREFWRSFKSSFKQSTIVGLLLLLIIYVLGVDCLYIYRLSVAGKTSMWLLTPFVVSAVFVVMWVIYVFAYIARFQNSLKLILKNSAFFVIRHLLRSILALVVFAASTVLTMFLPIVIVIVPTIAMFLITLILESVFKKYMTEEDLEAEEERNQAYYY